MKVIIEINEEKYQQIKTMPDVYASEVCQAIANGIPYEPKGDLISREALKEEIVKLCERINANNGITVPTLAFTRIIDNAPTVETDIEVVAKDAYEHGYTDGWKERFGEPNDRPQGEWIPVSERLPDERGNYLVTLKDGTTECVEQVYFSAMLQNFQTNTFLPMSDVLAWQPLPEPYKKGEWIRTALYGQTCLECNQCGKADFDIKYDNFCPNCGADMRKGGAE